MLQAHGAERTDPGRRETPAPRKPTLPIYLSNQTRPKRSAAALRLLVKAAKAGIRYARAGIHSDLCQTEPSGGGMMRWHDGRYV
jgi:hypothetical protein